MLHSTLSTLWASVASCTTDTTLKVTSPTYVHAVDGLMKQLTTSSCARTKAEPSYIVSLSNNLLIGWKSNKPTRWSPGWFNFTFELKRQKQWRKFTRRLEMTSWKSGCLHMTMMKLVGSALLKDGNPNDMLKYRRNGSNRMQYKNRYANGPWNLLKILFTSLTINGHSATKSCTTVVILVQSDLLEN